MKIVGKMLRFSLLATVVPVLSAQTLNLSSSFVNQIKNRATLTIHFELDAHLTKPHPVKQSGDDGDIHMAGKAPEVQLPMVVEIMNAAEAGQSASVNLMNNTPKGQTILLTGVWRIWFEHPSQGEQTQGDPVEVPANSNPNHVFEIHPVTCFGENDPATCPKEDDIADSSLVPIEDPNNGHPYAAYSATEAFGHYEKLEATINNSETGISISSKQVGYNYTEFELEPAGEKQSTTDGFFVLANVYDVSDDETPVTAAPRRMVFVAGTEPAKALSALPQGGRMHVLGIPRVNLAEVAAVPPGQAQDFKPLPYEMIIVAVLPDEASSVAVAHSNTHAATPNLRGKQ